MPYVPLMGSPHSAWETLTPRIYCPAAIPAAPKSAAAVKQIRIESTIVVRIMRSITGLASKYNRSHVLLSLFSYRRRGDRGRLWRGPVLRFGARPESHGHGR